MQHRETAIRQAGQGVRERARAVRRRVINDQDAQVGYAQKRVYETRQVRVLVIGWNDDNRLVQLLFSRRAVPLHRGYRRRKAQRRDLL